jgi:hypothetical protein
MNPYYEDSPDRLTSGEQHIELGGSLLLPYAGDVRAVRVDWSDRLAFADTHFWYAQEDPRGINVRQFGESVADVVRVSSHERGVILENLSGGPLRVCGTVYGKLKQPQPA